MVFFKKKESKKKFNQICMKYLHGKLILFVQKLASEDGFQEGKQIFIFSIGKLQKKKKNSSSKAL